MTSLGDGCGAGETKVELPGVGTSSSGASSPSGSLSGRSWVDSSVSSAPVDDADDARSPQVRDPPTRHVGSCPFLPAGT
jgi:hypothetical protein